MQQLAVHATAKLINDQMISHRNYITQLSSGRINSNISIIITIFKITKDDDAPENNTFWINSFPNVTAAEKRTNAILTAIEKYKNYDDLKKATDKIEATHA